jgi:hypothetical protein
MLLRKQNKDNPRKFAQIPVYFSYLENLTLLNLEWKFQVIMQVHTGTIILQMEKWGLKYLA